MRILAIFIGVFVMIIVKEYLVDTIQQYYIKKEQEDRRRHIFEMNL